MFSLLDESYCLITKYKCKGKHRYCNLLRVHYGAAECRSVMPPPPGPAWYCWRLRKMWEWRWGWGLWWGKCVSEGSFWSEGWVRSSLRPGRCRCSRHSPACATCDGRARHGTAACASTMTKKNTHECLWNSENQTANVQAVNLLHACKAHGCSFLWRRTPTGPNW